VVAKEGWNPGVIGVSASRLVDLTGKPTVILTIEGEEARGSARAPRGFNMVEALRSLSHLLEKHGGHESAAGLTIKTGNISKLQEDLSRFVDEHYPDHTFTPVIEIDLDLTPEELGIDAVGSFDLLGPYGMGNPQPLISVRDVMIGHDIKTVGSGKHLKFSISDNGHDLSCIWFNMGEQIDHLPPGTMVNLAGFPEIHSWGGRDEVQIRVNDMFING
jgi:single-stranded-DNA-specific exonuclease